MPIRADAPLRRVTMNFYAEDVEWMIANYGAGWTERVRQHIHNEIAARNKPIPQIRRTLGDLLNDR